MVQHKDTGPKEPGGMPGDVQSRLAGLEQENQELRAELEKIRAGLEGGLSNG